MNKEIIIMGDAIYMIAREIDYAIKDELEMEYINGLAMSLSILLESFNEYVASESNACEDKRVIQSIMKETK